MPRLAKACANFFSPSARQTLSISDCQEAGFNRFETRHKGDTNVNKDYKAAQVRVAGRPRVDFASFPSLTLILLSMARR